MKMGATCLQCLFGKQQKLLDKLPESGQKANYVRALMRLMGDSEELSAPALSTRIGKLRADLLGERYDFTDIKHRYNQLMLGKEDALRQVVNAQSDPLCAAMCIARAANYIDFSLPTGVDDALLEELLAQADQQTLDPDEYKRFQEELSQAAELVFLTDNCGEIVADKLLIEQLQTRYPSLRITVLVRGAQAGNDATMEDAQECGLTRLARCMGNGSDIPGTSLGDLSDEARTLLERADLILAKGQGNFETLHGCGLNVYYLFLCKCDWFIHLFQVERNSGLLVNERRAPF